jgi:hypothetical protein
MVIASTEWERVMTTNLDREHAEIELEYVSGGFASTEHGAAPKTQPSGSGQQEYLKITMSDVWVSSY